MVHVLSSMKARSFEVRRRAIIIKYQTNIEKKDNLHVRGRTIVIISLPGQFCQNAVEVDIPPFIFCHLLLFTIRGEISRL